jgi:hypothetical protein
MGRVTPLTGDPQVDAGPHERRDEAVDVTSDAAAVGGYCRRVEQDA